MAQKLTILFDLDGTLVDTAPDLMNAHNHVMEKFGLKVKNNSEIKKMVGHGANSLISKSVVDWNKAKQEFGAVSDKVTKDQMVKEFIKFYSNNINGESRLINGVYDFLKWSKNNNISMGVCTNKQEYLAVDLLKKIKIYDFFEYVAGSDTFDYFKPDPRHLTNVIEIMQGKIEKSLMIGDSETDGNAAKNANLPFILLEDGYTEKKTNEIQHDHLIKDYVGLEKIIINYLDH